MLVYQTKTPSLLNLTGPPSPGKRTLSIFLIQLPESMTFFFNQDQRIVDTKSTRFEFESWINNCEYHCSSK